MITVTDDDAAFMLCSPRMVYGAHKTILIGPTSAELTWTRHGPGAAEATAQNHRRKGCLVLVLEDRVRVEFYRTSGTLKAGASQTARNYSR